MEAFGLAIALTVLIILAFRGVNIIIASLISSFMVAVTNDLSLPVTFKEYFAFGPPLGAFTFMGRFFLLFLTGAMFGTLMAKSYAVTSIARALGRALGPNQALLIVAFSAAILTYGGVVAFVVVFVIYPLGLQLIQNARLPRRLLVAAMCLGSGTFTMTALPGTPSIHNVIPAVALNTDLYAGALLGILASVIMLVLGVWYLLREQAKLADWEPPADHYLLDSVEATSEELPDWRIAMIPMIIVILTIALPKIIGQFVPDDAQVSAFTRLLLVARAEPVIWPSFALVIGCITVFILFPVIRKDFMEHLGLGANNSIMPLINTAAVIGFGGVVTQTTGFHDFANFMPSLDLPPNVSAALSVNVISGIIGSSSGGLQIFMQTLAEQYLAQGIPPEILHRISAIACGCIDSLPHSGGVVALLTIMRVTHREGYKDLAMVTVAIPIIATIFTVGISMYI